MARAILPFCEFTPHCHPPVLASFSVGSQPKSVLHLPSVLPLPIKKRLRIRPVPPDSQPNPMKQPLVPVAIAFMLGIVIGDAFIPPILVATFSGILLALAALFAQKLRNLLLLAAIAAAGCTWIVDRLTPHAPADLRNLTPATPTLAALRGTIVDTPSVRRSEPRGTLRERTVATLQVAAIRLQDDWQPASGCVLATTRGTLSKHWFRGQSVEVSGVLQEPRGADADGLFNYQEFLRVQDIHRQLITESDADWAPGVSPAAAPPWSERFLPWAREVLARGLPRDDGIVELLWAMTLGWKTALSDEVAAPFMQSGTMHVFAISGLHIALIGAVITAALRLLRLHRGWCGAITIPLTWGYVAATGWQSSAIRSALMMTVVVGAWSLRRPTDLLNSLAGAAVAVLLWQPGQLFLPGFQLSFGVVGSMALAGDRLRRAWEDRVRFDPLLPDELRPRWQRWLGVGLGWLGGSLTTGIAAWLGSLPLVWHYFHIVNPVSLLANVIVIPLSSAALVANLASLLCGPVWPWASEVFNASAWVWMHWMVACSRWFAAIPGGAWFAEAPAVWWWIPYYAAFLAWSTGWAQQHRRRHRACLGSSGAILLLAVGLHLQRTQNPRIDILPGGITWIDLPGARSDLLLDPGSDVATRFVTVPFLRSRGVDRLAGVVITHPDTRHAGGIADLVTQFHPAWIATPSGPFRSPAFTSLMEVTSDGTDPLRRWSAGDFFGPWTVLHPNEADRSRVADDQAMVLAGEVRGLRFLFCSDLGRAGQRTLLERHRESVRADIVIGGVPLEGEPFPPGLLEATAPQLVVLVTADFPVNRRLRTATRERLERQPFPVWNLNECATVSFDWSGTGCRVRSKRGGHRLELRPRGGVSE